MGKEEKSMIDYNKLKLAHELAKNIPYQYVEIQSRIIVRTSIKSRSWFLLEIEDEVRPYEEVEFYEIDELISKIHELAQDKPKPKYEVGQAVWVASDHEIHSYVIRKIKHDKAGFIYDDCENWEVYEEDLFPSKQALIEAQIEYWEGLKYVKHCDKCGNGHTSDSPCYKVNPTFDIKGFSSLKNKEKSTHNDDMLTPSTQNLSSCCSVHTGITDECQQIISKMETVDNQSNQDEVDSHGCQHEHNFSAGFRCIKCGEIPNPKTCVHEYNDEKFLDLKFIRCIKCGDKQFNQECQHEDDERSKDLKEIEKWTGIKKSMYLVLNAIHATKGINKE
jgi:hypothetical protein